VGAVRKGTGIPFELRRFALSTKKAPQLVKLDLMNKSLLRKLKPFLSCVTPQGGRNLFQVFNLLEATTGRNYWLRLNEVLRVFILLTRRKLNKQNVSKSQAFWEISVTKIIASVWLGEWAALRTTFFSPAILLLLFLETTLDKNLVPERQDFTFEEIKQSLWDRYWPPQRQRCDFVAASAYLLCGAVPPV
jgi:hypothetical protein